MTIAAKSSPHQSSRRTVTGMMQTVIYCLCPGVFVSTWFFGIGVLLNITIAVATAVLLESLCMHLQGRSFAAGIKDLSASVTAILFALTIPPGTHWLLVVAGIGFAIVIAKHMYGGLGQNLFNPAMCGYLFLLLSFPLDMTSWAIPIAETTEQASFLPLGLTGIKQSMVASFPFILFDSEVSAQLIDGMTMATPLIEYKMASPNAIAQALSEGKSIWHPGNRTGWELVNIAYLMGGLILLSTGTIRWHIPAAVIGTVATISFVFYAPGSAAITGTAYLHLFGGATMLGAFFIATDPVSAAATNTGRLIYGVIIGVAIYCIRVWGSYLDAVAIAVIFGNFCVPLLDHFMKPRVYGHQSCLSRVLRRLKF